MSVSRQRQAPSSSGSVVDRARDALLLGASLGRFGESSGTQHRAREQDVCTRSITPGSRWNCIGFIQKGTDRAGRTPK